VPRTPETIEEPALRVAIRIPGELATQLKALATRDSNGLSATARRLIAAAIAEEQRAAAR
jgi:predicted DNA-binding protein